MIFAFFDSRLYRDRNRYREMPGNYVKDRAGVTPEGGGLDGGTQRFGRRPAAALALAMLVLWIAAPAEDAKGRPAREYQVKAVFLYHFVQFVQWPPESFPAKDSPLVVGILGEDPFDAYLEQVVKGEVDGRPSPPRGPLRPRGGGQGLPPALRERLGVHAPGVHPRRPARTAGS